MCATRPSVIEITNNVLKQSLAACQQAFNVIKVKILWLRLGAEPVLIKVEGCARF